MTGSKKFITLILAATISMSVMSSCKAKDDNEIVCRTREDKIEASPRVNLNVQVEYGGCGEDGNDLGSGQFEYDLECYEGMMLYEDGGYYHEEMVFSNQEPTIVIKKISDDGVVIKTKEGEETLSYGESVDFDPIYWTYDGTNYFSTISFGEADD